MAATSLPAGTPLKSNATIDATAAPTAPANLSQPQPRAFPSMRSFSFDLISSTPPSIVRQIGETRPLWHMAYTLIQLTTWAPVVDVNQERRKSRQSTGLVLAWVVGCLLYTHIIRFGWIIAIFGAAIGMWLQAKKAQRARGKQFVHRTSRESNFTGTEKRGDHSPNGSSPPPRRQSSRPTTSNEDFSKSLNEIQTIIDAYTTVRSLGLELKASLDWSDPVKTRTTLGICVVLAVLWVTATIFLPISVVCAVVGATGLLYHSPFGIVTRRALDSVGISAFLWRTLVSYGTVIGQGVSRKHATDASASLIKRVYRAVKAQHKELKEKKAKGAIKVEKNEADRLMAANSQVPPKVGQVGISDITYKFVVYENQRWWLGSGWTTTLLPTERSPWTDDENDPALPPNQYKLPIHPPTHLPHPTHPADFHLVKSLTWSWSDTEWHVDYRPAGIESGTDKEGWAYGSNKWENWRNKETKGAYTRRRKWWRVALLEEKLEVVKGSYTPEPDDIQYVRRAKTE